MRALEAPPKAVVSPSGAIHEGSFRGPLPHVDLSPLRKGPLYRLAHHKRWMYVALTRGDLYVGMAIVDLGYVKNAFAFAYDRGAGKMIVDRTALGHPAAGSVGDGSGPGFKARFASGKTRVELVRVASELEIDARFDGLEVRARVRCDGSVPPLAAIGPIPGGVVNATEKRALLPVEGTVVAGGRELALDGGFAGWDYTHGYLARHTQWRWAYLLGVSQTGERVAMNLVEGFLGERECGVFVDDQLHPVGEGRFVFEPSAPLSPWQVRTTCNSVDLRFSPGGMHADATDLKIVRSKFVQPVGTYRGTLRVGGRELVLDGVLGVTEDQDVLW